MVWGDLVTFWHEPCMDRGERLLNVRAMMDFSRFGLHYFPDTLHYRQKDLETWLPELTALGASWLVLPAPLERAIPEQFIRGLISAKIQPLLHFDLPFAPLDGEGLQVLFRAYADWGVQHVVLFDRPNLRAVWPQAAWTQMDLVDRFLDLYLPVADLALSLGLCPVFPPLQPGGDYWDLAFLRLALRSLKRRPAGPFAAGERLLEKLALAAYAGAADRLLDWGAGGPERWPGARPYLSQPGMQDQRGLHIYEWYLPVCQEEVGRALPLFLLGLGSYPGDAPQLTFELDHSEAAPSSAGDEELSVQRNMELMARIAPTGEGKSNEAVPDEVKAGCFWLLAAEQNTPFAGQSWYQVSQEGLHPRAIVDLARRWAGTSARLDAPPKSLSGRPIAHYILLPLYAWGAAEWDMALIAPLLQNAHPTVGFSLEEASLAQRVTVVGGNSTFSAEALGFLQESGCVVDCLGNEDGMLVATPKKDPSS
jgi:hypothetical protein